MPYAIYEAGYGLGSTLFHRARTLVRLDEEKKRPNSDRLKEFRDSGRESLELELFSTAPIYPELEIAQLTHGFEFWRKHLPDDPLLAEALHGRTPEEAAKAIVQGTKLASVAFRKKLADDGLAADGTPGDPMIRLAKLVDPKARAARKVREDEVEGVQTGREYALIARAIFADQGDLRLSGRNLHAPSRLRARLRGSRATGGSSPRYTTMGGAFEHAEKHGNTPPYELPKSWITAKKKGEHRFRLRHALLNFISTAWTSSAREFGQPGSSIATTRSSA